MLPYALGAGVLLSAAGAFESYQAAGKQASAQKEITAGEQQQESVRNQAMQMDARRREREMVRVAQRARAVSLTTAVSGGAQFGTGLQGAYGQTSGQTTTNLLGVQGEAQFGQQLFDISSRISSAKMKMADAGTQAALGAGLMSLGGSLTQSAGTMNKIG